LHVDIKARATILDPAYQKLPRAWPLRPFDVRTLPNSIQDPIHYFELFWTSKVFVILVENTNNYAQFKEARHKENRTGKSRWWEAVNLYEMRIFIALLIYISINRSLNIKSY
jgi:Transposase IS4